MISLFMYHTHTHTNSTGEKYRINFVSSLIFHFLINTFGTVSDFVSIISQNPFAAACVPFAGAIIVHVTVTYRMYFVSLYSFISIFFVAFFGLVYFSFSTHEKGKQNPGRHWTTFWMYAEYAYRVGSTNEWSGGQY